jgi:hypothetical protein
MNRRLIIAGAALGMMASAAKARGAHPIFLTPLATYLK